jgi:hypothetical protein
MFAIMVIRYMAAPTSQLEAVKLVGLSLVRRGQAHQPIRPHLQGGVFGDFFDLDTPSDAGYEKPKSKAVSLSIQLDSWRFFLTPFFNASYICENSS